MVSWGDGWRRMLVKGPSLGVVIGDRGFGGVSSQWYDNGCSYISGSNSQ